MIQFFEQLTDSQWALIVVYVALSLLVAKFAMVSAPMSASQFRSEFNQLFIRIHKAHTKKDIRKCKNKVNTLRARSSTNPQKQMCDILDESIDRRIKAKGWASES